MVPAPELLSLRVFLELKYLDQGHMSRAPFDSPCWQRCFDVDDNIVREKRMVRGERMSFP